MVVGLIAIRQQLVNVEEQTAFRARPELTGIVVHLQQARVEGTVRSGRADVLTALHFRRQQVDRSAKIGGSEGRSFAGATVEIRSAQPLRREIRPGVMGGAVGVFKRNAVESHGVLAVLKAAKISFALAQADAVWIETEGAGREIDHLGEIGNWRYEIPDEVFSDLSARRSRVQRIAGRGKLRGERHHFRDRDGLIHAAKGERKGEVFRVAGGSIDTRAARHGKARRRHFHGVFASGQSTRREMAIFAGLDFANDVARLVLQCDRRIGDGLPALI